MSSEEIAPIAPVGDDQELNNPLAARPARITAAPVGAATARGFYWQSTLSVLTKFVSMGSQIVISWFVTRKEFGLVSNSTTFASFIWLIQDAGLSQILIKRRTFSVWATSIFWLSVYLGLVTAILTSLAGLIAARTMHEHAMFGLMLLLGVRGAISSPSTVPVAQLNKEMRFALLASMGTAMVVLERGLMIFFTSSLFRWGAYGMITAMLIVSGVRCATMWWYARSPIRLAHQFRRWKYIARDSWMLSISQTCQVITVLGDNLLLALFCPADVVGDYYWAYNLSLQTTMLLTSNLGNVLFPALSKLQREPERMRQGFVRAARMLTMVGIPCCLLQAATARPLVEFVFIHRWDTAIPALQMLSVGMAMGLVNYPAIGMLRAQGRFSTERTLSAICAAIFLAAAFLGATQRGSLSMAIAVAIYNVVAGVLYVRAALGPEWRKIGSIFIPPLVLSIVAIGCGYLAGLRVSANTRLGCLEQIGVIIVIGCPLYAIAVRSLMPQIWDETMSHVRPIWQRLTRMIGM